MSKNMDVLHQLSVQALRSLAASLREGSLSLGLNGHVVNQLAGVESERVLTLFDELLRDGMELGHIATMLDAVAATKERSPDLAVLFELVLSGPDIPGVPMQDTAAAFQMLVQEAQEEVILVGYTVYNGEGIFRPLAQRLQDSTGLKVVFCLDIARRPGDTSLDTEIVRRFAKEFRQKHWPWPELPELYYDPRALVSSGEGRASLHAKCVVVDRKSALITSANFTEAAQKRNIELGILVRHAPIVERIAIYLRGLQYSGVLKKCYLD